MNTREDSGKFFMKSVRVPLAEQYGGIITIFGASRSSLEQSPRSHEMMYHTIRIERGISQGCPFFRIFCDGKNVDSHDMHFLSRQLTGTTGERGNGIFDENTTTIMVAYGDTTQEFIVQALNLLNDPSEKVNAELQRRIANVRNWITSVDRTENFSFVVM